MVAEAPRESPAGDGLPEVIEFRCFIQLLPMIPLWVPKKVLWVEPVTSVRPLLERLLEMGPD